MSRAEPLGTHDSLNLALAFAGVDVSVGVLAPTSLEVLSFLAFFGSIILLFVQLAEVRPYEWIAWFCLEASLVGIAFTNLYFLARWSGC